MHRIPTASVSSGYYNLRRVTGGRGRSLRVCARSRALIEEHDLFSRPGISLKHFAMCLKGSAYKRISDETMNEMESSTRASSSERRERNIAAEHGIGSAKRGSNGDRKRERERAREKERNWQ